MFNLYISFNNNNNKVNVYYEFTSISVCQLFNLYSYPN